MEQSENIYKASESGIREQEEPYKQESYESIDAFEGLKILWMLRFVFDTLIIFLLCLGLYRDVSEGSYNVLLIIVNGILILIFVIEMWFIVQFYRKKKGSLIPLHIYSAISLLNFPIGTAFSIYHYIKCSKLDWRK